MHRWTLLAVWLVIGCDEDEPTSFDTTTTTTPTPKSGGGFSSDLAKSMGGSAASAEPDPVSSGSGSAGSAGSNSGSGSASKAGTTVVAGSGSAGTTTMKPSPPASDASTAKAGRDSAVKAGSGSAEVAVVAGSASKAGSAAAPPPINTSAARVAVKPSPELAAIKISLSPNWERDVGEAGTISLVVKVPEREPRVFSFRYGYEDTKAPNDRELYKKWLADNNHLRPTVDRQRGGAWYLEGVDGRGAPAFRIVVNYGGRKLICGGPLYKDAISNQLGDIRDKTIIQAKEICETLQL